jgi:hypothetical protein
LKIAIAVLSTKHIKQNEYGMKYNKKVIENMKNRFVHYKIHSIELLWWFQSNYQCRSNAIENITNRMYPTSVWGDAEIVLNVAILRPSCYFFLRKIHFAISTAQKQYLMTAGLVLIHTTRAVGF